MRAILKISLLAIVLSACGNQGELSRSAASMSEDERHRLYTAALVASESSFDTELFQQVCKKIGIFDTDGGPNDSYMKFIEDHYDWAQKPETRQFKGEINTKEKAREYVDKHLR